MAVIDGIVSKSKNELTWTYFATRNLDWNLVKTIFWTWVHDLLLGTQTELVKVGGQERDSASVAMVRAVGGCHGASSCPCIW